MFTVTSDLLIKNKIAEGNNYFMNNVHRNVVDAMKPNAEWLGYRFVEIEDFLAATSEENEHCWVRICVDGGNDRSDSDDGNEDLMVEGTTPTTAPAG